MGDLSEHFSRHEFGCRGPNCCGHSAPVDSRLIDALEDLRELAGDRPLSINSGFRCRRYNAQLENSSPRSQHCLSRAADVKVPEGLSIDRFAELADEVPAFHLGGIGVYRGDGFVHLDVRSTEPRRWEFD